MVRVMKISEEASTKWPTRIEWFSDRWRHCPERSTTCPNMLIVQYLENSWRCYLATIASLITTQFAAVRQYRWLSWQQLGFLLSFFGCVREH